MLSEPVALTVHVVALGFTTATIAAGHSGVPTSAVPISSDVALRCSNSPLDVSFMFSVIS